jgi:pSer/pThr/pTyr-binding forkhead associated (FHA) protein
LSATDLNTYIWVLPSIFGVITSILVITWLYLMFAPGPRTDARPQPQPQPQPQQPMQRESDDTIIDQVVGPPTLTIQNGVPNTGTMPLPSSEFRVGRFASPEVQLALDEKTVSRNHALVRANPQTGQFSVEDLGSSFGTFIVQGGSNMPVPQGQSYPLTNGTVVQFGQVVRVKFNIPGAGGGHSAAPQSYADNDPYKTQF